MMVSKFKNYKQNKTGYLLVLITSISSVLNDLTLKISNYEVDTYLMIFFRYFALFVYLIRFRYLEYIINNYKNYLLRSVLLFIAIMLWIKGLEDSSISNAAMYSYFEPALAYIFYNLFYKNKFITLNYLIIFSILILTIFLGYSFSLIKLSPFNFNLFISVALFAITEAINKKYIKNYSQDLICISLIVLVICLPFIKSTNLTININIVIYLLSISALTIIMYVALFKAYMLVDMTNIIVLKYIEFPIAILIDALIFNINFSLIELVGSTLTIIFIYFINTLVLKIG